LDLTGLLDFIDEMPAYRQLVNQLEQKSGSVSAAVLDAGKPYLIASLQKRLSVPVLLITAQPENSKKLYEQLLSWCPDMEIRLFPEPEALPYEHISSDDSTELERIQVLSALTSAAQGDNIANEGKPLIITSAPALIQKVSPRSDFSAAVHRITRGMEVEPFQLLSRWQGIGYRLENTVEIPGTMSHRGGIIDVFPPTGDLPARLEFFGNTIESIRLFDPESQRSLSAVPSVNIGPAEELLPLLSRQDSLPDYLPGNSLLILDEPQSVKLAVEDLESKAEELRNEKLEQGEILPGFPKPYFTREELNARMESRQRLELTSLGITDEEKGLELNFTSSPSYAGQIPAFIKKVKEFLGRKHRLILVSHQASRLSELLEEEDIIAPPLTEIKEMPPPGSLTLVQGLLAEGWTMNGDTHLLTDTEIFGFTKQRRLLKKRRVPRHRLFAEITPDDYVVHVEHGIARFTGVITMSVNSGEGEKEYLVLEYAAGDKLYVPTDQIDRVSRYVGAGENPPVLSRLGTQEWSRTKQRVKESVADIAGELIALYASREVVPGFSFSPDTIWQQEVEASFPYVETPDQMTVQREVKEDMQSQKPMDRLVCGDVGYGKTEVAVRAAFKAVMDGKQVALLVPTTVLAEQHYSTFSQRLAAFPVKIEVLSRFRSPKEQWDIVEGIASGSVDICIGTHRLLQKDVVFKELGLLIIDEEQRFGVAHKEHLKQLRREVDVLTLSATPIPRTLHMSLVGVRDMSVMETPPEERLPIKTYVTEYSDHLIREAVLREMERNGQVFFVHNRVQSIVYTATKLQELVPEARIAIGHGQMPEGELEKVMADFIQGKSDILVCSSIIQSGLDMPNVNTLIVNRADKFGLTQLYQLRGRVGRGANLAYAYFLYDRGKRLTPVAELRLRTIVEASELGAGFSIAMKDLEIRGAGTLLGMRQSGHISAVGFNLYCQLLAQAVEEQKAKLGDRKKKETITPRLPAATVDLPFEAYIPEYYVADLLTRLGLYQKLAKLEKVGDIETTAQEFKDRFGMPPEEIENLLYAIRIKILATKAAVQSVSAQRGEIVISPFEGMRFERERLESLSRDGLKIGAYEIRLNPRRLKQDWQKVLEEVVTNIT
jgi:transcription-repair coupling factor (superfamily II helicase)